MKSHKQSDTKLNPYMTPTMSAAAAMHIHLVRTPDNPAFSMAEGCVCLIPTLKHSMGRLTIRHSQAEEKVLTDSNKHSNIK